MKHLVIVYGSSSAYLYVEEAWKRGFMPIILYTPYPIDSEVEYFKKRVGDNAIFMYMKDEPEKDKAVEELKNYDVVCVVAGSEAGTRYADRVAKILGKLCNDPETIYKRNTKKGMHQALKEAGIRYIKTLSITSEEELRRFWKENNLKKAMIKLSENTSSEGNKVVYTIDEAVEHYNVLKDRLNMYGIGTDVLIQEFIEGTEYIVDSVSCKGKHMITDIWKYNKILTKDNDVVYECSILQCEFDTVMFDLVSYAFKVLTATGFEVGPCHGEYKVDEKGPVLIETNARPLGSSQISEYLDECLGHHIVDLALDSYIDPDHFDVDRYKMYRPKKFAAMKHFICNEDTDGVLLPAYTMMSNLKSFRFTNEIITDEKFHFFKTVDLITNPLNVKLINKDENTLYKDLELLREMEKYPELMFEPEKPLRTIPIKTDYENPYDLLSWKKKTLYVTNDGTYLSNLNKKVKLDDSDWMICDDVIYAYTKGSKLNDVYKHFFKVASMVRDGGRMFIVPELFEKIPRGTVGVQVLLTAAGFKIEVPVMDYQGFMLATKS